MQLVFDNVPPNLRTELWLSQLHRGRGTGAAAAAQYHALVTQVPVAYVLQPLGSRRGRRSAAWHTWRMGNSCSWCCPHNSFLSSGDTTASKHLQGKLNPEVYAEIEKDAHRTFPGHPRWALLLFHARCRSVLSSRLGYASSWLGQQARTMSDGCALLNLTG